MRSNAVTMAYSYNDGSLLFDGTVPITDATGRLSVPSLAYYHSLRLLGRSANVTVALPYGVGTFEGTVLGEGRSIYRSGLFNSVLRLSVNLAGGPAMSVAEMRQWRQKTLLGFSLKVVAPTGQYDPTKLINLGANRWAFKPELGLSRRWGHWMLDAYASVWFFTKNPEFFCRNEFFPGTRSQTQDPIAAVETHLSYDVRPRLWVSLDGNFWHGGRTSLDGVENPATPEELPHRCHRVVPPRPAPVVEGRLRPGRLHPVRRRLPDRLGGVAVLVGRHAEMTATGSGRRSGAGLPGQSPVARITVTERPTCGTRRG